MGDEAELLAKGWRRCAIGQKTTQWCAIAETLLREQRQRDEALLRQALEGLRERCAQEAERITGRRRAVAAMINNEAVKPCEAAVAIRKIDVQQYYECALREIELLVAEWKRVAAAQAELHGEAEARADRLADALEDIRSRSSIDLAMRSDQFELTALLGDIYQIADAVLRKENNND